MYCQSKNKQEIARTLNDISKIVIQLKENGSIIRLGEKGLIEMLEQYKNSCNEKLLDTKDVIDSFIEKH
ncbi:MAG: hypothetical protein LBI78_05280 [Campylobacteraceae bacterium]|jgi:hypothetical protein|nr:hypothetical protein [Campylobacteraceae bacterium]